MSLEHSFSTLVSCGIEPPGMGGGLLPCFHRSPHPCEIKCGAHQRHFHAYFIQTAHPKASQAALLFQNPEHRLDQCLTPSVPNLSCPAAQPSPHTTMFGRIAWHLQRAPASIQFSSQVSIRHVAFDVPFLQIDHILHRKESPVCA